MSSLIRRIQRKWKRLLPDYVPPVQGPTGITKTAAVKSCIRRRVGGTYLRRGYEYDENGA